MNIWLELSLSVVMVAAVCGIISWYDRPRPIILVSKDISSGGWSVWLIWKRRLGDTSRRRLGTYETETEALRAASGMAREYGVHNGVDIDQS